MYLEEYLDTLESLPSELQRNFTLMRELDALSQDISHRIETKSQSFLSDLSHLDEDTKHKDLQEFAQYFSECLKHGEEKVALATQTYDMVDRHIRKLDDDLTKFEEEQMTMPKLTATLHSAHGLGGMYDVESQAYDEGYDDPHDPLVGSAVPHHRHDALAAGTGERRGRGVAAAGPIVDRRHHGPGGGSDVGSTPAVGATTTPPTKKRRNREASPVVSGRTTNSRDRGGRAGGTARTTNRREGNATTGGAVRDRSARKAALSSDMPIDPNEPTYCYCNQVSFGEMVACDDENCDIEWFHYACVGLTSQPKGKWYCKECQARRKNKRS